MTDPAAHPVTRSVPAPAAGRQRMAPRAVPLGLMRAAVTITAAGVFAQPVLAGRYLGGDAGSLAAHSAVAVVVGLLALLLVPFAVLLWRPGRGPLWPVGACVLLFFAVGFQTGMGYVRQLAIHVPLGVAIVATTLLLLIWVWRPRLGAPRPQARPGEPGGALPQPPSPGAERYRAPAPRQERRDRPGDPGTTSTIADTKRDVNHP